MILRDKKKELPYIVNNLERLSIHFKSSSLLVIENDSSDGSVQWLKEYGQTLSTDKTDGKISGVSVRSFKFGGAPKHIPVLAMARNEVLKAFLEPQYKGTDFLIMVDTDLCHLWDTNHIVDVFTDLLPYQGTHWDVLFANGIRFFDEMGNGEHYDKFAFRDHFIHWNPSQGILYEKGAYRQLVPHLQLWWENNYLPIVNCTMLPRKHSHYNCKMVNGQPLIYVNSAFGGLGIYSASLVQGDVETKDFCYYDSPFWDCEHVGFHFCLKDRFKAKLAIPTRLLIPLGKNWDDDGCTGPFSYQMQVTQLIEKVKMVK